MEKRKKKVDFIEEERSEEGLEKSGRVEIVN